MKCKRNKTVRQRPLLSASGELPNVWEEKIESYGNYAIVSAPTMSASISSTIALTLTCDVPWLTMFVSVGTSASGGTWSTKQ